MPTTNRIEGSTTNKNTNNNFSSQVSFQHQRKMRPEIVADNVESDSGILQDDDKYKDITDSSAAVYLEEE